MVLGPNVRERRAALGLSQEQLARRADVSLNAVHRIEMGKITDPHFSTLSGIARALGVSVSELVEDDPAVGKASAPPEKGHQRILPQAGIEREEGLAPTIHYVNGAVDGLIEDLVADGSIDRHRALVLVGKRVEERLAEETV